MVMIADKAVVSIGVCRIRRAGSSMVILIPAGYINLRLVDPTKLYEVTLNPSFAPAPVNGKPRNPGKRGKQGLGASQPEQGDA